MERIDGIIRMTRMNCTFDASGLSWRTAGLNVHLTGAEVG